MLRSFISRAWTAALLALLASTISCDRERVIVEPPPWTCDGIVTNFDGGRRLAGVQVWVDGHAQDVSDSSGAYHAILGYSRDSVDSLRFSSPDYDDAFVCLDSARVVADHRLALDVRMPPGKYDH